MTNRHLQPLANGVAAGGQARVEGAVVGGELLGCGHGGDFDLWAETQHQDDDKDGGGQGGETGPVVETPGPGLVPAIRLIVAFRRG